MGKKITQYPASAGNPDVTSLIDISEFDGSIYTSKKLSITQLIDFLNTNLNLGSSFTFKNNTGDTISKGMAVELSSASGLDLPEIALLSSSFSNVGLSQIFIANEDILNGNSGTFIQNGFLDNYYSVGLTVGQKIFWDVSSQSLTVVGTDIDQVFVGIVTVVDANGQLFVSPTRGTRTLTSQLVNDGSDTINPFITSLDVPAVPTLTSELTNDGADTINPFITALDLPIVPTLTSDLTNDGADGLNPFITALDIPTFASADKMVTVGRNSTGSTLYKGTIVYILGSTGNRPNFVKARADIEATSAGTFGVIESDIVNNADGNCVTIGAIDNLDTRSTATHPFTVDTLVDGDTIYLSPTTAGYITNVKPTAPDHLVYMGKVVETSPTNGTIVYRIQNGYELEELHNVAISSVTNNDILQYETSTSLWKNKAIPTASGSVNGYLSSTDWTTFNNKVPESRTLTINGTTQDLTANRSFTIAGLTYFTEAQNSSTPNATVKVDSLTALSSTTNADISIVPKGTGAFILSIPDNLVAGGNKRGANSIDMQTSRTQAIHVASADFTNLIGGSGNKATVTGSSVIGGYNNTGSGSYVTILGGYGCTNSGSYGALVAGAELSNSGAYGACVFGWASSTSGNSSFVSGYGNSNSGANSGTIGNGNITGANSGFTAGSGNTNTSPTSLVFGASNSCLTGGSNIVLGNGGTTMSGNHCRFVYARLNTVVGDAQNTRMILSRRTTNATLTTLTADGTAPYFGVTEFKFQDNTCVRFKGTIVAKQTATTNVGVWDIDGVVTRVNSVATTTIVVSNINVVTNASAWGTPTLTINGSYGNLSVNVIGLAATNIQWVSHIEFTEVVY
jgi:hypothetical protein